MAKDILLIMGSKTDKEKANVVLKKWKELGLEARVAIASCHKHGGGEFKSFIDEIDERIIVFLGGMSLAAPGLIQVLMQKAGRNKIIYAIPTDKAAVSAVNDLPKGTAIIPGIFNQVSLTHGLINNALNIANLYCVLNNSDRISAALVLDHKKTVEENPLTPDIKLDANGLLE